MEVGVLHLASAVKFTVQHPLTTATDMVDTAVTQAFGATPVSAMAMASGQDSEEDTANCTPQITACMAVATTPLATAPLVLAMDSVHLVSEQAVVVRRR